MTNAEKFQEVFGIYATKMWSMPEQDFLKWLNADTPQTERKNCKLEMFDDDGNYIEPQTNCSWK